MGAQQGVQALSIRAMLEHWLSRKRFIHLCTCGSLLLAGCHAPSRSFSLRGWGRPTEQPVATAPHPSQDVRQFAAPAATPDILPVAGEAPVVPEAPLPPEATAPSTAWTLPMLEDLARQNNPSIRQASASAYKAMGYRDQVGFRPNPTVGYSASQLADAGTDQHVAFVEQEFVRGGKLGLNQNVLSQEIQSQLWEVESQRYRVQTEVRQRFYTALAAQRRLELTNQFLVIAQKGVNVAKSRVEAKEGSLPEQLQSEIQLSQVEIQQKQAAAAARGTWSQLMAVVGLPEMQLGVLEGTLDVPHQNWDAVLLKSQIVASSPELQAARARVCRAQANVQRQQVQAVPNMSLLLAAGRDNGTDSGMINAQVGMPLPVYNQNDGNIAAAQAELCRASEEVHRLELAVQARVAAAVQDYEAAQAAVQQYQEDILPKAERSLQLTEQAYVAGEFDFLMVLVARRTFFDANQEYLLAQANLANAQALLEGQVLTGALDATPDTEFDSGLRDQSIGGL